MRQISLGLVAHVDAGKTTLSEALLYQAGAIRRAGRVDHGDAFLDTGQQERARGVTIFSKLAVFSYGETEYTLVDTPGHADFTAEMERTLDVLDLAVLVVSANDGAQAHTHTLWHLLARHGVPTVLFVNKMDQAIHRRQEILDGLARDLSPACVDFTWPERQLSDDAPLPAEEEEDRWLDQMTLACPEWTKPVLEGREIPASEIRARVRARELFPCFFGAALPQQGIRGFLASLDWLCGAEEESGANAAPFGARVFKIARDDRGERLTFLKVTRGALRVKDSLSGGEKVNQIRRYSGRHYQLLPEAGAGMIAAVTGPVHTRPGQGLGSEPDASGPEAEPFLVYMVTAEDADPRRLGEILTLLTDEDPKLHAAQDPASQTWQVRLMGKMQQEVLAEEIRRRFGVTVRFETPRPLYLETIDGKAEGVGHFEPLRHYAEVHLLLEAGERGSGIVLDSLLDEDRLERRWQHQILSALEDELPPGILMGALLTDLRVTLVDGKASNKHTSGGDFREAALRAVRQGLRRADPVLLEPWVRYRLEVPEGAVGRVMTELRARSAECGEPETVEEASGSAEGQAPASGASFGRRSVLRGRAPASELLAFQDELPNLTAGRGMLSTDADGFDRCHNAERVTAERGYDPDRDTLWPADSVFTSHGTSEIVSWDQVESRMHLPAYLSRRRESGGTDPYAMSPEERAARAERYREKLADEDELRAIFERTYGPIRKRQPGRERAKAQERARISRTEGLGRTRPPSAARKKAAEKTLLPERLLIDGYNLLHADPELEKLSRSDFGAARQQMIERLRNYQGITEADVTVVFDAYRTPGSGTDSWQGLRVVYTREDETADSFLERLSKEKYPGVTRVITSDALVQQLALGHGALRSSSREFWEEVREWEHFIRMML